MYSQTLYHYESKKIHFKHLFVIILSYLIFVPYPGFLGEIFLRMIDLSVIGLFVLLHLFIVRDKPINIHLEKNNYNAIIILMYFLFMWQGFVILYNSLFKGHVIIADVFDLYKLPTYFLAFYTGIQLSNESILDDKQIWKIISYILLIQFILSIVQMVFGGYTQALYSPRDLERIYLHYNHRAIGTFGNPNFLSVFATICASWYFYLVINIRKKRILNFFLLFISVFLILLTQSRTGFLITIFLFFILIIFTFIKRKKVVSIFLLIFLIVLSILFLKQVQSGQLNFSFFGYDFNYLTSGLTTLVNEGLMEQSSFKQRTILWKIMIEHFEENPFLGNGPSKGVEGIPDVADNNYIFILFKYGIIGLFLWLAMVGLVIRKITSLIGNVNNNYLLSYLLIYWIVLLLTSLTMESLESIRMTTIAFFLTGICMTNNTHNRKSRKLS